MQIVSGDSGDKTMNAPGANQHTDRQTVLGTVQTGQEFLALYASWAEIAAERVLSQRYGEVVQDLGLASLPIDQTFDEARKLISGGKRLRGALIVLGYAIAGGNPSSLDRVVDASIGYEFLHNAFLVHDDIMDRAPTRRHRESAWKTFARLTPGNSEHYGVAHAINLGDMIAFWGPLLMSHREFDGDRVNDVMEILNRTVQATVAGQILDINPNVTLDDLTEEYVLAIALNKTARYSFAAPLRIGAVLGGMNPNDDLSGRLESYAIPVGIAFQIQDDDLGVYGDETKLGKSVTSDLAEGKRTLLFLELFKRLGQGDRQKFAGMWGKPGVTETDLQWVRDQGTRTGAQLAVLERAQALVIKAIGSVSYLSQSEPIQRILTEIATFAVDREK
jgi:geranylgeranyl diphosphate synthase, type I